MKSLIASITILGLVGMVVGVAVKGAGTGTVAATVTPQLIAVSVSDGNVSYGVLNYSASAGSPTTEDTVTLGETQVITNDGNVNQNFAVKSSDAIKSTGTIDWDLVLAVDIDTDDYCHQYSTDAGTSWTDFPINNGYTADIITGIAPAGTDDLDLQILMPTGSTDIDDTKTITVTVLATTP